jgi:S1-C subfamily serine protease
MINISILECLDMAGKRIFVSVLTSFVILSICMPLFAASDVDETLAGSVVKITAVQQDFDYTTPWKQLAVGRGAGSGFVIDGKRILTNAHNVSNCKYVEVKKQNIAKRYQATVSFIAHDCDLAIVNIDDPEFFEGTTALSFGPIPKANSTVQTYGFPLGGRHLSITEGIVSRIQMDIYAHTRADSHLVIQTDAAINPGNSGGPVVQEGKVVGLAFQGLMEAENIGYMIPTTVIEHFLTDIADGTYDGFGSIGFAFYPAVHNASYGKYLKLPAGEQGIVITYVMMHSSVESVVQSGDVLTKIGDYDIDNDGMIKIHGLTLHMAAAVEQKQIGEDIKLTFFRQGELKTVVAKVALNTPILEYKRQFDTPPRYVVFAGLTFTPISRNFLETWGRKWITDIPHNLRYLFTDSGYLNTERDRKEYVVLSEILPDTVNEYSGRFKNKVVETINGQTIHGLADLPEALAKDTDGFCLMKFMGDEIPLIINVEQARLAHPVIMKKYNIPADQNLETPL